MSPFWHRIGSKHIWQIQYSNECVGLLGTIQITFPTCFASFYNIEQHANEKDQMYRLFLCRVWPVCVIGWFCHNNLLLLFRFFFPIVAIVVVVAVVIARPSKNLCFQSEIYNQHKVGNERYT